MLWLERTFGRHTDIIGLLIRKTGQLNTELVEMQAGDLLIQVLWQSIDFVAILTLVLVQGDLRQRQ